ncbi:helix-turn-helix domain-containing protein [Chitinophaga nivalis]|uniref:Helix-turn-helix domain-containing protein n=1 Tax=Chitinophaga nivalis TaxID=2991709 RepID=A0ABT3IVY6_9BACT|nr:helix-turn-helix domain-containing protein [Chitinophaga nivalis]MCW3462247.1 helix-turn-helix domain-containing protein [Chitinophaga nivalis]MCW3488061.1 helix-turn-helix domain-containing protein [Chitinophaga nivalis]
MLTNRGVDIPYQQLPYKDHFSLFPLNAFKNELTNQPHRHDHFQVIWFTKAKGRHMVDFVWYEVEDNMLFLLRPGQVHQLDCEREGHFLCFTEQFYFTNKHDRETLYDFTNLFDNWQGYGPIGVREETTVAFHQLIALMNLEMSGAAFSSSIIKHYLNAFLLLAEREKKRNATENMMPLNYDGRVLQLRRLLEQHYKKEHQVAFYANAFALTPKRLNEITKENTSRTVTELLHDRIILEAKRNLAFSHKSVKEICYELGFEDPAYFSRFFKNNTGISPQDFRDMMFK